MSGKLGKFDYYTGYEEGETSSESEGENEDDVAVTKRKEKGGGGDSSEDEIYQDFEQYLTKTSPTKKQKKLNPFCRSSSNRDNNEAESFENEMDKELDQLVQRTMKRSNKEEEEKNQSSIVGMKKEEQAKPSSSSVQEKAKKKNEKKKEANDEDEDYAELKLPPRPSDDELFYDPDMDEADQNWLNKRRKTCQKQIISTNTAKEDEKNKSGGEATAKASPTKVIYKDAKTDAVLNCPCCMTMLCMDCQRHQRYLTQYRAMFVFSCKVNADELLKYPKNSGGPRKKKKATTAMESDAMAAVDCDEYKAVVCQKCNTTVGAYDDKDEIYHFFNVLSSHS